MASTLDGPGQTKMAALEDATIRLQRIHGIVEKLAIAIRTQQETASFKMQIQRNAVPLASLLKPNFGMLADQITGLVLIMSRGGAEQMKLRAMREGVASARMQIEISMNKVKEKHTIHGDEPAEG
ncbi:MAG: hypothetical protein U0132_12820 [Gemmatimonadaceae bacterium]